MFPTFEMRNPSPQDLVMENLNPAISEMRTVPSMGRTLERGGSRSSGSPLDANKSSIV